MGDEHLQLGGETLDLQAPVVHERGRHHQQVGAVLLVAPAHRQHAEHLDGLAEAHVVGQTAAELQAAQRPQPLHADLLIRAQLGPQTGVCVDLGPQLGRAQCVEPRRQPFSGDDLRPFRPGVLRAVHPAAVELRAGQHAHRLAEADVTRLGPLLYVTPLIENLVELVPIDLDPFALDLHQAIGGCEQGFDLLL